jgi:hypothetical protein
MVKIISVRQPWAWLLFHGKDIENRTWRTSYRGPLLIHASQAMEEDDFPMQRQWIETCGLVIPDDSDLPRGAIVGSATLTDVHDWASPPYTGFVPGQVKYSPSPWFEGPYGFHMADAVEFAEPIPCRGQLGLRDISDALAARVSKMIAEARLCK